MSKKNKKTIKKKELTQAERHFGVILEDIDSKLDLVVEGQEVSDNKFTRKFEEINKQFSNINEKLNIHTEMIGSMKIDVEIIKQDIEFIKSGLKKKVDFEEFTVLERRVIKLEKILQSRK